MHRIIRNIRVMDPSDGFDAVADLAVAGGRIVARGTLPPDFTAEEVLDGTGLIACPGFIETSFQAHSPGHGRDGDLASELRAAVAGGVTQVLLRPDTLPMADIPAVLQEQRVLAERLALANVHLSGALTTQLQGAALTEMAGLAEAGAIAFSQAKEPVLSAALLRLALSYAADLGLPVLLHGEQPELAANGVMHEGRLSIRLGLTGRPAAAEQIGVQRDIAIAALSACPIHFPHLSIAAAVAEVAAARQRGEPVTCGVSIHHLLLTEQDVGFFNLHAKTLPPLRAAAERDALRHAIATGAIMAISSDHSPWGVDREGMTFTQAPFGIAAVEWLLPLALRLMDEGVLDLMTVLNLLSVGPAQVLGLPVPSLAVGATADLCIFDPESYFTVEPGRQWSRGRNLPYGQWELRGQVRYTLVAGRMVFRG
ncbi:amidohydrolase [Acidithiobacillus ferrivorans SS3]|uniref:Amidohydrolase n=1 Tax=Acidithiobacillus ferrivorans SS3 TaxID=743299 RepID=G0JTP8_9PROT|nr:dihydroorotase [Acidithiobacillus ferrivorans]AEM49013.1 amidohydrolase [Acidithiobacillus ferrivorans SS3]MBU2768661.1 dihydroorotase [Acidithiobacillus ferrivorans]MBU2852189.1 dihydroorotase [Acidithiobacillus ferrivorans]OFA14800.1 dihydroorotase [Acidithiobacillus ferrivorans]